MQLSGAHTFASFWGWGAKDHKQLRRADGRPATELTMATNTHNDYSVALVEPPAPPGAVARWTFKLMSRGHDTLAFGIVSSEWNDFTRHIVGNFSKDFDSKPYAYVSR